MRELERKLQELQQQVCYHAGEIYHRVAERASAYIYCPLLCACAVKLSSGDSEPRIPVDQHECNGRQCERGPQVK
jgi:hypothetical protein